MNKIYSGDCLFVMEHDIPDESVDLVYLDPPFFTGNIQKAKGKWLPGAMGISFEDSKEFWGAKGCENAPGWIKYIATKRPEFASYLWYMLKRLDACRKVLKPTGSIYLHCDYRASHYLKMVMDEIFGVENFKNEIIWCYRGGGLPKNAFARKHDIILFYSKSDTTNRTFNIQYKPYSKPTQDLLKSGSYGITNGNKYIERGGHMPDWWDDINSLQTWSPERLGYPTQKPLALLERIINASSNSGDVVLDAFCGCGTAIIAAQKLGRNWVGIDIDPDACIVMRNRFMKEFNYAPDIIRRQLGEVIQLKEYELEQWVNEFYSATKPSPDMGVDGITPDGIPIQVKTGEVKYNVVSQFLTDIKFHEKVPKPVTKGIIFSNGGFDTTARSMVFRIKDAEGIDIKLITPRDLLGDGRE